MEKINISIIIPVKNGISTIKQCLDAIFAQTLIDQTEVIIIDSGSTDGTLDIVRLYPVRLYQIPPESFNHGATRNYGVSLAKGEFVVMTVQDAVASDKLWLHHITIPLTDKGVIGVSGRQVVPHKENMNPGAWYQTFSAPKTTKISYSEDELNDMLPGVKKSKCGWDNVTAAYKTEILKEYPFVTTNYSEDIQWAYQMFKNGFTLAYAPQAMVFHYHHETLNYRYKRHLIEISQHYFIYNFKTKPVFKKNQFVPFFLLLKNKEKRLAYWALYNLRLFIANRWAEAIFSINLYFSGEEGAKKLFYKITKEVPIGKAK